MLDNQEAYSMTFNRTAPFNDLPRLPPQEAIETIAVLKKTTAAARALAGLKEAGEQIPNQAVLINTIPLLEAQKSSEIENIVTTADELLRFAADLKSPTDPATKEAYRYGVALHNGYTSLNQRPVSTRTAIEICSTIHEYQVDIRTNPGTIIVNPATGQTIYTPPEGQDHIRKLLANWEEFIHGETNIDPLIRMAVMHYQFVAIHPFTDGNGRTGRILNILYLIQAELLNIPILYLSRYILLNRNQYYKLLRRVTEHRDWEAWILYMLSAVEETAIWTAERIKTIKRLQRHTRSYIQSELSKRYSRDLIDQLFMQPYVRIDHLVKAGIAKHQTASTYLRKLAEIGVLREMKVGRSKYFVHTKFWDLLTGDVNGYEDY